MQLRAFSWTGLAALALVAACSAAPNDANSESDLTVSHTFDLASHMPAHLAVMFSMSWFGIPSSDPQGPGPDPSYGNSKWGGGCIPLADPAHCSTCVLRGAGDVCIQTGAAQRDNASRRRPLAGIYSASAKDTEGRRRVDLMLSSVRRSCDDGAKIDTWAVQLNGTYATSAHPSNPQRTTSNIAYDALSAFLGEADAAGMTNAVMPGDDGTWYFHFGSGVGLGACDDTANNPKQKCIDALSQDFADMAKLSLAHPSSLKIDGKPVLFVYFDSANLSPSQWQSLLASARNARGHDFYVVAASQNPSATSYFAAFDAMSPWINLTWANYSGSTIRAHATNWAAGLHAALYKAVGSYPGRVVFGAATPGFDDFTEKWGKCVERQLVSNDPRDPDILHGEFDYFRSKGTRGVVMETWDDWTEGSEFEPDVAGGASALVELRQELGSLYGESADASGDQRLANRWQSYGQARNCSGGAAKTPPLTNLVCSSSGGVTISSPSAGATVTGPVHVVAQVSEQVTVSQVQVWDNGTKLGNYAGTNLDQTYDLAPGAHTTTVLDLDSSYAVIHKSSVAYTVAASCSAPTITDPTMNEVVGPAIDIQASAPSCIVAMKAYLDGAPTAVASVNGDAFPNPTWVSVSTGTHALVVNGWDAQGNVYASSTVSFTR